MIGLFQSTDLLTVCGRVSFTARRTIMDKSEKRRQPLQESPLPGLGSLKRLPPQFFN